MEAHTFIVPQTSAVTKYSLLRPSRVVMARMRLVWARSTVSFFWKMARLTTKRLPEWQQAKRMSFF